jgi:hypothetical protein
MMSRSAKFLRCDRDVRISRKTVQLGLVLLVALHAAAAAGGSISGTVRDGSTGLPLPGMDIDLLDDRLQVDNSADGLTGPDGGYVLSSIEGSFFVRCDARLEQGVADQYWPQAFLPSQAQLIFVGPTDDIVGIDFVLQAGGRISGRVVAGDTALPLTGIDIDVRGGDGSFLPSVDSVTDVNGQFQIGIFPPGQYFVKPDPTILQGYVPIYHVGAYRFSDATPIDITALETVDLGIIGLPAGGAIAGTVIDGQSGAPIVDMDMDLYSSTFQPLAEFDANTDELGAFAFHVPIGTYYVRADPNSAQPYEQTFFGPSPVIELATPMNVVQGLITSGIDFVLEPQGFISGTVTDLATGQALAGVDLDVLDASGLFLSQFDDLSASDGSYSLGPLPPGQYIVRADAADGGVHVDQYHPGVFAPSGAMPIAVNGGVISGVDFALARGGWIRGTVRRESDSTVLPLVDLDVFTASGERIPSVDANADGFGVYRLGALPSGTYYVQADPDPATGLAGTFHPATAEMAQATPVQVLVGLETAPIDIAVVIAGPTATPATFSDLALLRAPHPNPFSERSAIHLRQGTDPLAYATLYDVRGRRVRSLQVPVAGPGETLILEWDGRDSRGKNLGSGTYYLKLGTASSDRVVRLTVVR